MAEEHGTTRYRRPFRLEVVTPEGRLCSLEVVSAVFPASDGLVGVLGGHGPMVAMVGAGPLTLRELGGDVQEFYVAGGFAHVESDSMRLLAEECTPLADLDREAAWEEIQRARALPAETAEEIERRRQRLTVAQTKFNVAQKYFKRTQQTVPVEDDGID